MNESWGNYTNNTAELPAGTASPTCEREFAERVVYGYVMPVVGTLGMFGNLMIFLTLRRNRKSVTYFYLFSMAIADTMAILSWLPNIIQDGWQVHTHNSSIYYYAYFKYELINVVFGTNALLTVAITAERFMSVMFPIKSRDWMTFSRAKIIVVFTFVFPLLCELPVICNSYVTEKYNNETSSVTYSVRKRAYNDELWYRVWYTWIKNISLKIVPIVLVVLLNILVSFAIRRQSLQREKSRKHLFRKAKNRRCSDNGIPLSENGALNRPQSGSTAGLSDMVASSSAASRKAKEGRRLLVMFACVSSVFLICEAPKTIFSILYKAADRSIRKKCWFTWFTAIANVLEVVNASINFYVFLAFGKDFRRQFWRLFQSSNPNPVTEL